MKESHFQLGFLAAALAAPWVLALAIILWPVTLVALIATPFVVAARGKRSTSQD